jgi:hypothetical protein
VKNKSPGVNLLITITVFSPSPLPSMLRLATLPSVFVYAIILAMSLPPRSVAQSFSFPATPKGVAVVELFTSEGCSSCPSADRVLERVVTAARASNSPVYALSFHVDYWNHLGWRDPYSSRAFSDRQRAYSEVLKSESIYTPQMVVGGIREFVGSDAAKAAQVIAEALQNAPAATITLRVNSGFESQGNVQCAYTISGANQGAAQGAALYFALVHDEQPVSVKAGENAGRNLAHVGVVRSFVGVPQPNPSGGTAQLPFPSGVKKQGFRVIAFLQNPSTMKIFAATAVDL